VASEARHRLGLFLKKHIQSAVAALPAHSRFLSRHASSFVPVFSKLLDHFFIESWNVIWLTTGYETIVDDHFFVNPVCAGIT
jgi:hypothetical protein